MQTANYSRLLENVATNLKRLRAKHGYSQLEVSVKLELARNGYQKIEYNQVSDLKLSTVIKILDLYGVDLKELIK